ncbi:MAG: N-acetylglucosamine-6-phosphate deacetylase [Elusimicrobia bacterium]|nr:N-acetylglucosamine-6-phosphate deacetylase [Elusimicrobiota bacterium]
MDKLITNCRLISPDLEISKASIAIKGKYIEKIYSAGEQLPKSDKVYDANGKMAVPGFIDIHFHGNSGFDFIDGTLEAAETIAKWKLNEGVTTMVPATLTAPEEGITKCLQAIADYQKKTTYSKVAGMHLEGPYINPTCLGAMNPKFVRKPDIEEVKRLNKIVKVLKVTFATEVEGGLKFIKDLSAMGIASSCGHSAATYEEFYEAKKAGLKHLTHFCNQMTKLHHREIGLVGAGLLDNDILTEVICDKVHLCVEMIQLIFKVRNVEKIVLITDASAAAWLKDGNFQIGGLDVKVENGEARLVSNGALAGSTIKYYDTLKNVYEITGLPLSQLIKTTSYNQAKSLGIEKVGEIKQGYFADIAILDDKFCPKAVFVNGELHEY